MQVDEPGWFAEVDPGGWCVSALSDGKVNTDSAAIDLYPSRLVLCLHTCSESETNTVTNDSSHTCSPIYAQHIL